MKIHKGRWAVTYDDGDLVVFLIGMRINHFWKVRKWGPISTAMPRMIKWLEKNPQAGLLRAELAILGPRSIAVIQYWRSFEDLERFARSPDAPHLEPWKSYNRAIRGSGDVGVWHETYVVGRSESIFVNMPARGLAAVGTMTPLGSTAAAETAAQRIGERDEMDAPVEAY